MIKRRGNLFDTELKALGHGVNCKGVMGAGVAKTFRTRFPENYQTYRNFCSAKALRPGGFFRVEERGVHIFNMASQDSPGADARYPWLLTAATAAAKDALRKGISSIAIPMIGAGIGGLEWNNVETLLRSVEILNPGFEWEVWKL